METALQILYYIALVCFLLAVGFFAAVGVIDKWEEFQNWRFIRRFRKPHYPAEEAYHQTEPCTAQEKWQKHKDS